MRIACPACAATYDVPEGRVSPGRMVRCARCETDWAPIAEAAAEREAAAPEPDAAEAAYPMPEMIPEVVPEVVSEVGDDDAAQWGPPAPLAAATDRYATSSGTTHLMALRAAWAATGIVLLVAAWLAFSARESVMQAWPPSVRAYAALGLVSHR